LLTACTNVDPELDLARCENEGGIRVLYEDADGDGCGVGPGVCVEHTDQVQGYVENALDWDDTDPNDCDPDNWV